MTSVIFSITWPNLSLRTRREPFTHQLVIKAFFQPFNALSINVGKTYEIRRYVACRIEPAGFLAQVNAREIKIIDPLSLLRGNLSCRK